jgi:hypothetical protein
MSVFGRVISPSILLRFEPVFAQFLWKLAGKLHFVVNVTCTDFVLFILTLHLLEVLLMLKAL